jgi:maltooligosyltrehalose trehalohydrolase
MSRTASLLATRHKYVIPRLAGAMAIGAKVLGPAAVSACWRMGDGTVLVIAINLADAPAPVKLDAISTPAGADLLFQTEDALACLAAGEFPAYGFIALLEPAV